MNNLSYLVAILFTFVSPLSQAQSVFNVLEEIDFGTIFFKQGICDMDPASGDLSNVTGVNLCAMSAKGTVGRYVITTEPNKMVTVKLIQRNSDGDGLVFIPAGHISSISEDMEVPADIEIDISSGSTGVVRLYLGGRLQVMQDLEPSSNYSFSQPVGIEWSVAL